jgi:Na+/H+ antiporter NhaD/arsenite permease-like protein
VNWFSLLVVVLTLLTIVIRSRGIGEAWPAAGGALARLLVGDITPGDLDAVGGKSADGGNRLKSKAR